MIAEVPSDTESIASNEEFENDDLFDINNIEVDILQDAVSENASVLPTTGQSSDESDSESNLPLTTLARQFKSGQFMWQETNHFSQSKLFADEHSPVNIADEAKSPFNIFCYLFPSELIETITFQTNLYATQNNIGFVLTTVDEIRAFLGIIF
ncbi:Transposase IS4 [Popillia japonica]|uniref:Transposase IS4 n=1 Tax=Popillia japonica TaxID=7064 RepID=A0AAW1KPG4_POPJA